MKINSEVTQGSDLEEEGSESESTETEFQWLPMLQKIKVC